MTKYKGLKIDYKKDDLLTDYARDMIMEFYSRDDEKSPQEVFARACNAWSTFHGEKDDELAQRLYGYVSNKWFMFASPVLSNAPDDEGTKGGLPISCFLTYVPDSVEGLINHSAELRWLSVMGGGVGGHWSDVRSVSDIAPGPIPFLHTVDADMTAYKQGKTRKGSYAAYMDVTHPDIMEFMQIRVPTGDVQRKALNLHNAVNITDDFMQAVKDDREYELIDPKSGPTGEMLSARKVWQKLLETRFRTGEPYLNFIDTANRALPQDLKDAGLTINGSNLCNEIHLPTSAERTAVCCLSSLNLEYYDEWKDTRIVEDLITMLDNVLEFFIEEAPKELNRAVRSARNERSIGLGAMGFHSYLQKRDIAFEDWMAEDLTVSVFRTIKERALEQSVTLGKERGNAPDMQTDLRRHAHLLAIAPNASSGIILSTSPSIEPSKANAYTHRTRAGSFLVKNKFLEEVLKKYKKNNDETWSSIITSKGSVQHLEFLSNHEKDVFKTSFELDQEAIITLAGLRQEFICQGQSVNLFFQPGVSRAEVNKVHISAWEKGLKGLYYLRTESKQRAENVAQKVERDELGDDGRSVVFSRPGCPWCERAKDLLTEYGYEYEEMCLDELGKTAATVTGRDVKTVPQVYVEGQYVGGYEDLVAFLTGSAGTGEDDECRACEG